ncbi:hypothetical protein WJX72_007238 [[Myrmecia] bisecta]|uniref:tRNA-specific adenosine deaminase 1 n=1 Tax=[Myrmecia] bisecta TaxID=41462 RepID=A0AAW1PX39_9CHLO
MDPPTKRHRGEAVAQIDSHALASAVLKQYAALPKTGKPQHNEHTVLAGFAVTLPQRDSACAIKVVALGTGTKCLGGAGRSLQGEVSRPAVLAAAQQALQRAVVGRVEPVCDRLHGAFAWQPPRVQVVAVQGLSDLALCPTSVRTVPSGVAINWSSPPSSTWAGASTQQPASRVIVSGPVLEVTLAASGRRAGAAKKGPGWNSPKTRSSLCRACLLDNFRKLAAVWKMEGHSLDPECLATLSYRATKAAPACIAYAEAWNAVRAEPSPFGAWIAKPDKYGDFGGVPNPCQQ